MKFFKRCREHFIYRLAMLILLILLFLLCLCILIGRHSMRLTRQNTLDMNERLLAQAQNSIHEYLESLYNITTVFCYSPTTLTYLSGDSYSRLPDSDELAEVFSNILLLDEHILNANLYNTRLQHVAAMGKEISLPEQKRQIPAGMEIHPKPLYDGRGNLYYELLFPIYDLDSPQFQKLLGMCSFLLEPDCLAGTLTGSQATEHTGVFLLDASGTILTAAGEIYFGSSFPPERQKSDADHYYYSLPLPFNGWRLVSLIPEYELRSSAHWMKYATYIACLVSLLSFGILIFYYNHYITRPILHISEFIQNINTHPKDRLHFDRADEIGIIANNLNHMLDDAYSLQAKLQLSQRRIYESELAKKQAELLAYRNQINPHFLYNTFECIRGMALYHDADDIAEITLSLSNVFRFAVKGADIVSIDDEVNYILEYAKIIEYRFRGKISIDVEAGEPVRSKKVFKLLLQPLVENAVFHGLEPKNSEGLVDVRIFSPEHGRLCFIVEDDGCGIEPEKLNEILGTLESHENTSRVGLSNIYQRLKLFYNDRFTFRIDSTPGTGTCITIHIPDSPYRTAPL